MNTFEFVLSFERSGIRSSVVYQKIRYPDVLASNQINVILKIEDGVDDTIISTGLTKYGRSHTFQTKVKHNR